MSAEEAVVSERIAVGDRIPLHVHRVSEVILAHGSGRFTLGNDVRAIGDGAVIFIPAGVPHGFHNDGEHPLPLQAVFPTTRVWLRYVERNPAPGLEDAEAQPEAEPEYPKNLDHFQNFAEAVRARNPKLLHAEIEETAISTALCHLGNISYRVGRDLRFDPAKMRFTADDEANALLTRKYRAPYVVPERV